MLTLLLFLLQLLFFFLFVLEEELFLGELELLDDDRSFPWSPLHRVRPLDRWQLDYLLRFSLIDLPTTWWLQLLQILGVLWCFIYHVPLEVTSLILSVDLPYLLQALQPLLVVQQVIHLPLLALLYSLPLCTLLLIPFLLNLALVALYGQQLLHVVIEVFIFTDVALDQGIQVSLVLC